MRSPLARTTMLVCTILLTLALMAGLAILRWIGAPSDVVGIVALALIASSVILVLISARQWSTGPVTYAVVGVFLAAVWIVPTIAFAADNVVTTTAIDLSPVVNAVIQIVAAILLVIGVPMFWKAWTWIANKTHLSALQIDDAHRATVNQLIQKGIGLGVASVAGAAAELSSSGKLTVETKSKVVGVAAQFALDHGPDALAHFGVNAATPAKLADMVAARFGMLALSAAAAPATLATATGTSPEPVPAAATS